MSYNNIRLFLSVSGKTIIGRLPSANISGDKEKTFIVSPCEVIRVTKDSFDVVQTQHFSPIVVYNNSSIECFYQDIPEQLIVLYKNIVHNYMTNC